MAGTADVFIILILMMASYMAGYMSGDDGDL